MRVYPAAGWLDRGAGGRVLVQCDRVLGMGRRPGVRARALVAQEVESVSRASS